jgi:heptosyltransferase-3
MQGALIARLLAQQGSIGIDYPRRRDIFWRSCFTHLVSLFPSNAYHTVEQNLAVLAPLGIQLSEQPCCRLEIADEDRRVVQEYLRQHQVDRPYLVVHPAARWVFKCWEDDRFAAVIQYFASQGWPIILTSSPEKKEVALVDAILKNVVASNVISLAGQLTLGQLAALIAGSRLFLGVDSVPMHMAAALKKDVVALFGPTKIKEWHPWQTRYRLIDARDYGSLLDPDAVNTATQERYLKNIPVAPVIEALESLLGSASTVTSNEYFYDQK